MKNDKNILQLVKCFYIITVKESKIILIDVTFMKYTISLRQLNKLFIAEIILINHVMMAFLKNLGMNIPFPNIA